MIADTTLLNIQVGILGVVLVIAAFYLWRLLSRIDMKLDRLILGGVVRPPPPSPTESVAEPAVAEMYGNPDDEDQYIESPQHVDMAETLMKQVFGGMPVFTTFTTSVAPEAHSRVVIEEEPAPLETNIEDVPEIPHLPEAPEPSEESAPSQNITKTRVKKMNLDELRTVCRERNLSPEGTRAILLDRVLASLT